jgi:hypothetical protein
LLTVLPPLVPAPFIGRGVTLLPPLVPPVLVVELPEVHTTPPVDDAWQVQPPGGVDGGIPVVLSLHLEAPLASIEQFGLVQVRVPPLAVHIQLPIGELLPDVPAALPLPALPPPPLVFS